ncbi:MAG: P-loop NTPase [Candidatus Bathyarchaeota archaeon]
MKITICGKGGSGKSSITVLVARALSKHSKVYIFDSDESNTLLPRMLGVNAPRPIVEYLGGKKNIFKEGEVNLVKALSTAGHGIELDSLPQEYLSAPLENVRLLSIGKIREFGEGCACSFNFITRALLKNLALKEDEHVLVDTDAGMEYVGRSVIEGIDAFLAVGDPTAESLVLLNTLRESAVSLGKKFWLVLNKVTPEIADRLRKKAGEIGLEVSGVVNFDKEIFNSGLDGSPLKAGEALADVQNVLKNVGLITS